jgi:integrase/recombinase XerD
MALVYKRGNTWWVRFRINGHHIRRSARTTRKAEAVAFLQRLLDEYAAKARGDQPRHRYVDAVERFFQEASIKPKTRTCYQSSARACETVFGALHLDEIDRRAIAEFVSARKRSGLTDTTVRRDLAFLSSLCTLAVRWGWLDTNPVTTFSKRSLKEARPRTRFLTSPEFEHLLATASENLRPALILAVETGLRREELFGLTTADIDLGKREIHLEQTKTNSPRRVPMSDTAMVTVRDLLRAPGRPRSPYLLCKPDGSRYGDMRAAFASACRRAKIADFRWHDLRHTFASWFVQRGGDLYHLSRILGHTTIQMTTRYGRLSTENLHAEMKKVAQIRPQKRLTERTAEPASPSTPRAEAPENSQ